MFDLAQIKPPEGFDQRRQAKFLYWMGWRVTDIAAFQGQKEPTVHSWKQRDEWDKASAVERMEAALEARFVALVLKEPKSGGDFKEIDLLGRQATALARVRRYEQPGGHEGDLNPAVGERNAKAAKSRPAKNHFDEAAIERLQEIFHAGLFGYQLEWWGQQERRCRIILKSRQIGATWYFAREALLKAVTTGRNQIFLSASKNQAHIFRQYMVAFAKEAGVELTGDPIILSNDACIYFLGTNARTAQGYHGDFYFDEFFWTFRFKELNKVASAMATHKHWKKTYFSTPSTIQHEAYGFWTGDDRNKGRRKADRSTLDLDPARLKRGFEAADRRWRHLVTVEDAAEQGCELFDIEELRDEHGPAEFANLFMCEFVDDTQSVFPLKMLAPCMVDAWEEWDDYAPLRDRPVGNRPVWIGYDPSYSGDHAALIVALAPTRPGEKFRLLEKFRWQGLDVTQQARAIEALTRRYNVAHIGIDATGMGIGVYQLVKEFFPNAKAIHYSPESKTQMVLKALAVLRDGRLEFDHGWTDLCAAFMAIRQTMTKSGREMTYEAGRTDETGHADLAWACMHILVNEPLAFGVGFERKGSLMIFGEGVDA
jgi:uncharacterized protein YjcR